MSQPAERLGKIAPEQYTEAQKKVAAAITSGPRGEVRGPFGVLLRSPGLAGPIQQVGEYLRYQCPLDRRVAEMATLIAARHWTQQYEWQAHYTHAMTAGLKPAVADAIAEGRRPDGMAEDEAVVYDLLTEALHNHSACDATYARAIATFGEPGTIDLLAIAGYYGLMALVMNVARTALPAGKAPGLKVFPF